VVVRYAVFSQQIEQRVELQSVVEVLVSSDELGTYEYERKHRLVSLLLDLSDELVVVVDRRDITYIDFGDLEVVQKLVHEFAIFTLLGGFRDDIYFAVEERKLFEHVFYQ
jgi:hypothetical protein